MTGGVLVVGYGNVLRTDDGVGWHAAERLARDSRLSGATVLARHQLTPELALDISQATFVVLLDAGHDQPAGTFAIAPVERTGGGSASSHHLDPATLLALADELYGPPPSVFMVRVGVESVEVGDRLSPIVEAALPRLVDAVAELVGAQPAQPVFTPVADLAHA